MAKESIPVVDLSLGEEACVLEVKRACETYGFFYLTGVDKVVTGDLCVNSVFEGAGRFFQLPQEKKDTFKAKRIDEHPFGYQSAVLENIKLDPTGQKLPDQREQLKFGRGTYLLDYHAFMNRKTKYCPGSGGAEGSNAAAGSQQASKDDDTRVVWLSEEGTEKAWRSEVNAYFEHVSKLGHHILTLLSRSLGLESQEYFDQFFDRALELMNFNYYHPTKSDLAAGKLGCGSHTDYGMITILMTDKVPGLQVCKDKAQSESSREWIDVEPRENHFVVNVGDMLERWSNGRYVSNLHRVNGGGQERLSIAFFFEPNVNARIVPLGRLFADQKGPREYQDVVYGEWLAEKYKKTGEVL